MPTHPAVKTAYATNLGIVAEEVRPGYARLHMDVTDQMINSFGKMHGGAIVSLAETALEIASNSYETVPAVALGIEAHYLTAGLPGQRLVAVAEEEHLGRRTGMYRMFVRDQATGEKVAELSGRVYRLQPKNT